MVLSVRRCSSNIILLSPTNYSKSNLFLYMMFKSHHKNLLFYNYTGTVIALPLDLNKSTQLRPKDVS